MGSFGSVNFGILITSTDRAQDSAVSELSIPGGGVYVDISGPLALHIPLEVYFADGSDYASLEALVGTQATLVTDLDTISDAYLKSLRRTWRNPFGSGTKAQAEFIIPSVA